MQHSNRWMVVVLIMAGLLLAGCSKPAVSAVSEKPALVELIEGTELNRVVLTERAAQRLDIQTASIREEQMEGKPRLVIPYAALIYDLQGGTWAYTSPEPLTFVRASVTVDFIEGDNAVLLDGPPSGTAVATVGVAELYGADTGIGK